MTILTLDNRKTGYPKSEKIKQWAYYVYWKNIIWFCKPVHLEFLINAEKQEEH